MPALPTTDAPDVPEGTAPAFPAPAARHAAPEAPVPAQGFWPELRDALSLRTAGLIVGVLLLQLAFILSYVGAFHAPAPSRVLLAVVAPQQVSDSTVAQLDGLPGTPLAAAPVADAATAQQQVRDGEVSAALIVDPNGTTDTLLTAGGGGTSVATAVQQVVQSVEAAQQRTVTVQDVVPLQSGDARGLTGFYLVTGWTVGGYLVAALLGVSAGARPATPRRGVFRLAALVPYALLSGLGGAVVVDSVLGALTGHFLQLWAVGALVVFTAGAVTMAFQVLLGVLGIGLAVLLFVVLGNPSAGGAYQAQLLPPFWRGIGGALPNGAGTDIVRRVVYFGGSQVGGPLLVLAGWAVAGVLVALVATRLHHRRATPVVAA